MINKLSILEKTVVPGLFAASTMAGVSYQTSQPIDLQQPIPLPYVVAQGVLTGVVAPFCIVLVGLATYPIVKFGIDSFKFGYYFIKAIPRMRVNVSWKEPKGREEQ